MPIQSNGWEPIPQAESQGDWEPIDALIALPKFNPSPEQNQFIQGVKQANKKQSELGQPFASVQPSGQVIQAPQIHDPEEQERIKKSFFGTLDPIPNFTVNKDDSKTIAAGKTALNLLKSVPDFLLSPVGLATLPLGGVAPKTVATIFGADALHNAGKQIISTYQNWDEMSPAEKTAASIEIGGSVGLAGLLGHGIKKNLAEQPNVFDSPQTRAIKELNNQVNTTELRPENVPVRPLIQGALPEQSVGQTLSTEPSNVEPFNTANSKVVRPPKVSIPEIPPEQVAEQKIIDSIKSSGSTTVPQIQELFKNDGISREDARRLRNLAYPNEDAIGLTAWLRQNSGQGDFSKAIEQQTKGEQSASKITSDEGLDLLQQGSGLGEGTPLQQQGETAKETGQEESPVATTPPGGTGSKEGNEIASPNKPKFTPEEIEKLKPKKDWQVSVQHYEGTPLKPTVQLIDPSDIGHAGKGGDRIVATVDSVRSAGHEVPDFSSLQQGKYTFEQAKKLLDEQSKNVPEQVKNKPVVPQPNEPSQPVSENGDVTGIAHRVSEERGIAAERGIGISPEDSIERGRELLSNGGDAQKALDDFNNDNKINADIVALVRAKVAQLAKNTDEISDAKGSDSPEYKSAFKEESDWIKKIKPMQTEWSKIGQAQQGATDIDTGTFTGLQRAHVEATGKEFTPKQSKEAKNKVSDVKTASKTAQIAKDRLFKHLDENVGKPVDAKVESITKRIISSLDNQAAKALERIKSRSGRLASGLDPADLADHAIYGAAKLSKGVIEFGQWASEMTKELGDYIKPHLEDIYESSNQKYAQELRNAFGEYKGGKFSPEQIKILWSHAKDFYINKGENDYGDILDGLSTDFGLKRSDVAKALAQPKGAKRLSDEMYAKLSNQRQVTETAKNWLKNQRSTGWLKFLRNVPKAFFAIKVFGHGTVGMITHAGLNIFNPAAWKSYWPAFFQQFKLMGLHDGGAYHERMMDDLVHDKNYITARRAGLANDPHRFTDDYQNPEMVKFFGRFGLMGNRGFDALKTFRQARFNQIWDKTPQSMKTPKMAELIADSINHATGTVKTRFPEWANVSFFAPRLEGSRWAWLVGDPAHALATLKEWKNSTPERKQAAISEIKQKAAIAGTYLSLLAINQGLLSAMGSKQRVNVTDPRRSDFLSFKIAGHNLGVVGPLIGAVRFLANLLHASMGNRTQLEKATSSRADEFGQIAEQYARGKLSPFLGFATDVASQSDFQGRPLPFSSDKPKKGVKPYTYGQYALQQFTPIPISEAVKEVWKSQGMNEDLMDTYLNAITVAILAGGTGARLSEDTTKTKHGL